jgi:hypothetical protein
VQSTGELPQHGLEQKPTGNRSISAPGTVNAFIMGSSI